jgi:hypothetical protein
LTDDLAPEDIPSLERGPRQPNQQAWTGTGTPRSADDGLQEPGAVDDRAAPIDPAITVGATTSSHPAEGTEMSPNRSGSGGSGGAMTEEDASADGSTPRSMDELLTGDPGDAQT